MEKNRSSSAWKFSDLDNSPDTPLSKAGSTPPEPQRSRFPRWPIALAALAAFGFASITILKLNHIFPFKPPAPPPIRSIAVLPLVDVAGPTAQEYFSDGLTQGLTAELGQISALRVISRRSAQSYKGSTKTPADIGKELQVDGIIIGSVGRQHDLIHLTVRLFDVRTNREIWTQSYERDTSELPQLQIDAARGIAERAGARLTPAENARFNRIHRADKEAVELYMAGLEQLNAGDAKNSAELLRIAVEKDPYFAPAHAALANAYGWLGEAGWVPYSEAFAKERAEALRAIELDDSRPEPHVELAKAAMDQNWDWATQKRELERALALGPSSADAHWAYADYLNRTGNTKRGLEEAKTALSLDPHSSRSQMNLAFFYYFSRQYDLALEQLQKAEDLHGNPSELLFPYGDILVEKGFYDRGIRYFEQLGEVPHGLGHIGNAYARQGDVIRAQKMIDKLKRFIDSTGVGRYETALIYAGLRQNDKAFEWLEQAYEARDKGITFLLIDPCIDPLRTDPRFKALVDKVGFPHEQ